MPSILHIKRVYTHVCAISCRRSSWPNLNIDSRVALNHTCALLLQAPDEGLVGGVGLAAQRISSLRI